MLNLSKLTQSKANTLLHQVSQSTGIADASEMYGNKTFQEAYHSSKSFAHWIGLGAQAVSALLASSYFYFKIALPSIPFAIPYLSEGIAGVFTLGILVMLEYLKREILTSIAVSYFKSKSKKVSFKVWLMPVAVLLLVLSVYTSFEGAKIFVSQSDKSNIISDDYSTKIAALTKEESDFRKSISWQGKIDMTNKANAKILAGFEDRKSALHAEKNKEIGTHQQDISGKGMNVAIFSLIMEILAICAFCFVCYVNFYVFVESHTQITSIESESLQVEKVGFSTVPNSSIAPNNQSSKVGFQFGSNAQVNNLPVNNPLVNNAQVKQVHIGDIIQCEFCGNDFTKKTLLHRFCSKSCKLSWHKENNGFDLKLHNKKKGGKI